jgi:hypothetical protein
VALASHIPKSIVHFDRRVEKMQQTHMPESEATVIVGKSPVQIAISFHELAGLQSHISGEVCMGKL